MSARKKDEIGDNLIAKRGKALTTTMVVIVIVMLPTGYVTAYVMPNIALPDWLKHLAVAATLYLAISAIGASALPLRTRAALKLSDLHLVEQGVRVYKLRYATSDTNGFADPFSKAVVVWGNVTQEVINHEIRHVRHLPYLFVVFLWTAILMVNWEWPIPLAAHACITIAVAFLIVWTIDAMERDADIYGFKDAGTYARARGVKPRPKSRLKRLAYWLIPHPPEWIRASERYYDRRVSTLRLFLEDVFRP